MAILKDLIVQGNTNVIGDFNGTTIYEGGNRVLTPQSYTENFYFVQGSSSAAGSSTSGTYLATRWEGTIPSIPAAVNGLKIAYRIGGNPGVGTGGVVLSIDGVNYYPIVIQINTKVTTHYPVGSTILMVFNSTQTVADVYLTSNTKTTITGCWQIMEYDSNSNSIGYQLRTNSTILKTSDAFRYYKILFTSADGTHWVPASSNTSSNATASRVVNQRPIDPFGEIVYCGASTNYAAEANIPAGVCWQQYNITLGYSFNRTGSALTLTANAPLYIKCAPQSNGSAIMDSTTPYVQALPTTEDGKIYIFLGIATSATAIELVTKHPVYYYKSGAIRLWTGIEDRIATLESTVNGIESLLASI